jgi:hypothetical protein
MTVPMAPPQRAAEISVTIQEKEPIGKPIFGEICQTDEIDDLTAPVIILSHWPNGESGGVARRHGSVYGPG